MSNLRFLMVSGKAGVCRHRVMADMPGVVGVIRKIVAINLGGLFVLQVKIGDFRSFRESFRDKQFELKQC